MHHYTNEDINVIDRLTITSWLIPLYKQGDGTVPSFNEDPCYATSYGFNGARIPNPLLKTSYFIESIEHKHSVRAIDCATVGNVTISRW